MVNQTTRQLDIYEIFERVDEAETDKDRVALLQSNESPALKDICRGTFDETIQWVLPEGKPPFVPNLPESTPSSLLKQNIQFRYFVKGGPGDSLPNFKREKIFIGVLESIHPADAAVVVSMINKQPPAKTLTKEIVQEAFPDLILR